MRSPVLLALLLLSAVSTAGASGIVVAPHPVERAAQPLQAGVYSGMPDDNPDSGRFLVIAGSGTITNQPVILHIGVPSGETIFEVGVFDGDQHGHWDQWVDNNDPLDFTLYEDPLKDGTGGVVVSSWRQFDMLNDRWYNRSFPTTPGARAPSGNYFYRLEVQYRNPGLSGSNNYFKVRTTGQISIARTDQFGFCGGPSRVMYPYGPPPWEMYGYDPPIWAGDPNPDPAVNNVDANSYDGNWDYFFYVPTEMSSFDLIEGDADFVWDATSPGAPQDGPSPYDGCNVPPNVYYLVTDPYGLVRSNYDPSGNVEWETMTISGILPAGMWQWDWRGMDAHNVDFIDATFEMYMDDDPPLPVSPAPELEPDNAATVFPDTTVDYAHTLTNRGARAEYDLSTRSARGWSLAIYHDANGNGVLEAGEEAGGEVDRTPPLDEDEVYYLILRTVVPPGTWGQVDTARVTASSRDEWNVQDSAFDATTVLQNRPPECDAGPDLSAQCDGVQLLGSAYDPEGDPLEILWTTNCSNAVFFPGPDVLDPIVTFGTSCNVSCVFTLTVTDDKDGTCEDSTLVEVNDDTPPTISGVPPDETVECDSVPPPAQPYAFDNCDPDPVLSFDEVRTDGGCLDRYILTRTWTAEDNCGNTNTEVQVVTVRDTTAPVLSGVPADETVECDSVPAPAQPTSSDNCDPAPVITYDEVRTDGRCDDYYTLTRTWTATDRCGNATSETQVVTVQDTVAPTLAGVPADETVECDSVPAPAQPTSSDNCDPAPVITYDEVRTDGRCDDYYTLTRTWTATDRCGNSYSETQVVTVQDTVAPPWPESPLTRPSSATPSRPRHSRPPPTTATPPR